MSSDESEDGKLFLLTRCRQNTMSAKAKNKSQDGNNSDNERTQIRAELSTMSFEDLIKLKDDLGSKVYNEAVFGESSKKLVEKPKEDLKRANKNRPREISTKRPVQFLSGDRYQKSDVPRDPRFDANCGDYDMKTFKRNYEFINDIREKEVNRLREEMKKSTDEAKKKNLKFLILRLENQNHEEKKRKIREQVLRDEQNDRRQAREAGRLPRYKTKKERKTNELVKQYLELKKDGKLDKHLEKRRKKNTAKDRKKFSFD